MSDANVYEMRQIVVLPDGRTALLTTTLAFEEPTCDLPGCGTTAACHRCRPPAYFRGTPPADILRDVPPRTT